MGIMNPIQFKDNGTAYHLMQQTKHVSELIQLVLGTYHVWSSTNLLTMSNLTWITGVGR